MELTKNLALELQKLPAWAKNILIVAGASILLGLFAHLAIPLPFTPVPIATQSAVVLLMGVLLGQKRSVAAVAAFLAQAAIGFPVLATGASGVAVLVGPTAGYLFGYLAAAFIVATIIDLSKERSLKSACFAMIVGSIVIFACGAAWLATFVGIKQAIVLGVLPFLIGDALKVAVLLKLLQWLGWNK